MQHSVVIVSSTQ